MNKQKTLALFSIFAKYAKGNMKKTMDIIHGVIDEQSHKEVDILSDTKHGDIAAACNNVLSFYKEKDPVEKMVKLASMCGVNGLQKHALIEQEIAKLYQDYFDATNDDQFDLTSDQIEEAADKIMSAALA